MKNVLYRKRLKRFLLGSILAAILFFWRICKSNSHAIMVSMGSISVWALASVLGIVYTSVPLRTVQRKMLLSKNTISHLLPVFVRSLFLEHLASAVVPSGGEIVSAYSMARSTDIPFSSLTASVFAIRTQDLSPLTFLVAIAFGLFRAYITPEDTILPKSIYIPFIVFIFATICTYVILFTGLRFHKNITVLVKCVNAIFPQAFSTKLNEILRQFVKELDSVKDARYFLNGQVYAASCWVLFIIAPIPLLVSYGLGIRQSFLTSATVTGIVTLIQLIPRIGICRIAYVRVLNTMNPYFNHNTTIVYAIVTHLLGVVSFLVLFSELSKGPIIKGSTSKHLRKNDSIFVPTQEVSYI